MSKKLIGNLGIILLSLAGSTVNAQDVSQSEEVFRSSAASIESNKEQVSNAAIVGAVLSNRPHPKHHFNMHRISIDDDLSAKEQEKHFVTVPHPKTGFMIRRYVGS